MSSKYPRLIEDINNDGKADVVAFGASDVWCALSKGDQFGTFYSSIHNFGYNQAWRVDKHPRFVGDLDGDGFNDLVGYGDAGVYGALNNKDVGHPSFVGFKLWSPDFGSSKNNGFYTNPNFIRTVSDVNNDEKLDLVVFANDGIHVALSTGTSFSTPTRWIANFGTSDAWNNSKCVRLLADINGDGYTDVLGYGIQGVWAALNNKSNSFTGFKLWSSDFGSKERNGFYLNAAFKRTVGDADGDGKADLIVFAKDGVYVARSNGAAFGAPTKWVANFGTDQGWDNTKYDRVIADVNSDSKVDIVGFGDHGTYFAVSAGTKFTEAQMWVSDFGYEQAWRPVEYPRFVRDVNGDGVLDLTGYGYYGVYVSESAPLYACDPTYFPDTVGSNKVYVSNGLMARVHLPRALANIDMPSRQPGTCPGPLFDAMHPVGPNQGSPDPWVNQSWRTQMGTRFAVNANFFDIAQNPYTNPCSNGLGLAVSNGTLLSPYSKFKGHDTDVLLIYNAVTAKQKGFAAEITPGKNVGNSWQGKVQFAFSGMQLVKDGAYVASQPDAGSPRARNAVGLTADGNTLIFLTQNHGYDGSKFSATLPAMADALIAMGAHTALNLDGSGSAQMWFKNKKSEFLSLPSDAQQHWAAKTYRPIPVVFAIK